MSEKLTCEALEQRIRELERAEEEARQAAREWNTTFEAASDAIWTMGPDQRVRRANHMAKAFFHDHEDDFVGKHCWKLIHGTDEPIADCPARRVKKSLVREMMEMQIGDQWFQVSVDPILDADGRYSGLVHILRDISKRKLAEEALAESEKKFRLVTETIQEVFWMSTPGVTQMLYVSPAYEKIWKKSTHELYASPRDFLETIHPEDLSPYLRILDTFHAKGKAYQCEYRIQPEPGSVRWIHERGYPIADDQGNTVLMTGLCTDITDYMKAIEDKEKAQIQLAQAQKMEAIGNLAGGIAHDFNNILTSIIGFTELALDDVEKGSIIEESLQEVYIAGKRAKDLVEQILAFARQADEPTKPIQIAMIVKEALKFIRSSLPSTIELQQNLESNAFTMGNPSQIHQIIMNLCTNAADAMDSSGGILRITLGDVKIDRGSTMLSQGLTPGDFIEMEVSDTGTGIPTDILDLIFEPYFTTKAMGEGSGLGLSVVQGLVEKSGGKIVVESQVGTGTTFRVYLPITKARENSHDHESEVLPTGTERILFIDDEAALAKLGGQILQSLGYTVITRTDSIEALALFSARPKEFDLIISDMTMPKMTGDVLAGKVLAIRPDIPIIIVTGYNKKISSISAREIGISALVYKPLIKAELAKTVRKVLDGHSV